MPSIRAPDDAPDVVSAIKHLFSNRLHTDFTFISRDGRVKHHVHRLFVAMQSPVLAKLLFSDNPIQSYQVKYDDSLALQNLISFIYNEDLVLENVDDIRQTKAISERYAVTELGEICREELINVPICVSNVLSVLELSREDANERKESECLRLICENQETIFNSTQFLGLTFGRVIDIFEKIKKMSRDMMTEALFLRFAIKWLDTNGNTSNKELLMKKVDVTSIPLNDYLDIVIDFPVFFSNIEISYAVKELKSQCPVQEVKASRIPEGKSHKKHYRDVGIMANDTFTEKIKVVESPAKSKDVKDKEQLLADVNFFKGELHVAMAKCAEAEKKYDVLTVEAESRNLEIERLNKEKKVLELRVKKLQEKNDASTPMSSLSYTSLDKKQKHLSILILNPEDGVNVFELQKRARITVQEGSNIRCLQVSVDDVLKKGLIGTVADKKGNYSESDVDVTYEGVYFMIRSIKQLDETLSPPQFIEVLKAALHFQLKDVAEKCIKRISGIVDYDPLFLDGLRALSYLKDKCLGSKGLSELKDKYTALLLSEPLRVILHPNFTKCSVDLILLLLQQSELKVKDESQLLLVVIAWLEAEKESRRLFRPTLLKNIAIENVSTADFRYVTVHYPNFFDEKEQKLILAYRNAVGSEIKFFRDNLPEWYSTKTRRHI